MRRHPVLLLAALSLGCGTKQTALIVEIWSDLDSPADLDKVELVLDSTPLRQSFPLSESTKDGKPQLVTRVSLVPESEPSRTKMVQAAGLKDGVRKVAQSARVSFVSGERRVLTLFLGRDCLGRDQCDDAEHTCRNGACVSNEPVPGQVRRQNEPLPSDFFTPSSSGPDGGSLPPPPDGAPPIPDAPPVPDSDFMTPDGPRPDGQVAPDALTCGSGMKLCGATCIPQAACCLDGDCPPVSHGAVACGADHTCSLTCAGGYHDCSGACASDGDPKTCGGSCTPCMAPTGGGTATCMNGMCGATCPGGMKICGTACIDMNAPCMGTCNPGQHTCNGLCVLDNSVNSCGPTRCTGCPVPGNSKATCTSGMCGFTCNTNYKKCGSGCIADTACCTPADCPAAPSGGSPTCTGGACGFTCNPGLTKCGNTCKATAPESCFNGVDDDCNGLTDCADPACTPSTTCVPSAPSAIGVQVAETAACPAMYGTPTQLYGGLTEVDTCTGCDCNNVGSMNCSVAISRFNNGTDCMADVNYTFIGNMNMQTSCLSSGGAIRLHFDKIVRQPACGAPHGTGTAAQPTWTSKARFCSTTSQGGGCNGGQVCVPASGGKACFISMGSVNCPAGYTARTTWYTGYGGTRTCSCTCGNPTGGGCQAVAVRGWKDDFCTDSPFTRSLPTETATDIQCNAIFVGFNFVGMPAAPTCSLMTQFNGGHMAQGQMTLCCLP